MIRSRNVKLPSEEEDGKPSYDRDFEAGFKAGAKALIRNPHIEMSAALKAYRKVSRIYGSWWIYGFTAQIDESRGVYGNSNVIIAEKMGLL